MSPEGTQRRKKPHLYEILIIPVGEDEKARTYRASRMTLLLLAVAVALLIAGLTISLLVFTPLALYIPIPNPELEARYGRMIRETQERLTLLAQDVVLLRDYNSQLRKALGEEGGHDTSAAGRAPVVSVRADTGGVIPSYTERGPVPEYDQMLDAGVALPISAAEHGGGRFRLPLMLPTDGYVTQGFDPDRNHFGVDFAGKRGTPVVAAADGHVVFAGWTYQDGNIILIQHSGGFVTVYKHNQSLLQTVQTHVDRGEPIALLGMTGKTSFGPHLHFEVWKDGVPQDPNIYMLTPLRGQ